LKFVKPSARLHVRVCHNKRSGNGVQQEIGDRRSGIGGVFKNGKVNERIVFPLFHAVEKERSKNRHGGKKHDLQASPAEIGSVRNEDIERKHHDNKDDESRIVKSETSRRLS